MSNAQRRIPPETEDSLEIIRGITLSDTLLVMPGMFMMILSLGVVPPILTLQAMFVSLCMILFGIIAVFTAPSHYDSTQWVMLHLRHRIRPPEYRHNEYQAEQKQREQTIDPSHGIMTSAFSPAQRTQDFLGIQRVYPSSDDGYDTGAVELEDGTLIGAIRVDPANMTLSTHNEWRNAVGELTSLVNTLRYPVQIHYTTREFDAQQFLQPYEERLTDADVMSEPVLEELLNDFLQWYPYQLAESSTRIAEFYVIVGVKEEEVERSARTEGLSDKLEDLPLFSLFFGEEEHDEPEAIQRGKQRNQLFDRLEDIKFRLSDIEGVDAERVTAESHAQVISRAWRREKVKVEPREQVTNIGVVTPETPTTPPRQEEAD